MSTHRLTRLDTYDFYQWVNRLGFSNEYEFWQSLSGLSGGASIYDHMNAYLTSLGYQGHADDMVRQFLIDQIAVQGGSLTNLGTLYDWSNCLWNLSFGVGETHSILDDDGNVVTDDDGNTVTD